jgi:hypothetical protein
VTLVQGAPSQLPVAQVLPLLVVLFTLPLVQAQPPAVDRYSFLPPMLVPLVSVGLCH